MRPFPILAAAALSVGLVSYAAAQIDGAMGLRRLAESPERRMSSASRQYMDEMDRMAGAMNALEMTGRPAPDFVTMMIPYRQAAVAMAETYLGSGDDDPDLVKLSRDLISAQARESTLLKDWQVRHLR